MSTSRLDPNISLACNLLDACRILDDRARPSKSRSNGFGVDINNETFSQMFAMACYMCNALREEGIRGVYRSLPFAYYYHIRRANKLPKFWITVRMLSLLPKFAEGKHKKLGRDLIPIFLLSPKARSMAFSEFTDRGGHRTHAGLPLSFVPEIDSYWLGDEYIDVFQHLTDPLRDLLIPMSYAEYEEARPFDCDSESALMGNVKQFIKEKKWIPIVALFLALFLPDQLRHVVDPDKEYGIPYTTDGLLRFLGDTFQFAPERMRTLFITGMDSVYLALGSCGVDIGGRQAQILEG